MMVKSMQKVGISLTIICLAKFKFSSSGISVDTAAFGANYFLIRCPNNLSDLIEIVEQSV